MIREDLLELHKKITPYYGEVFIQKMKKAYIINILREITGRIDFEVMGLYPGEKIHEELVSQTEVYYCFEFGNYILRPTEINNRPPNIFLTENAEEFTLSEL